MYNHTRDGTYLPTNSLESELGGSAASIYLLQGAAFECLYQHSGQDARNKIRHISNLCCVDAVMQTHIRLEAQLCASLFQHLCAHLSKSEVDLQQYIRSQTASPFSHICKPMNSARLAVICAAIKMCQLAEVNSLSDLRHHGTSAQASLRWQAIPMAGTSAVADMLTVPQSLQADAVTAAPAPPQRPLPSSEPSTASAHKHYSIIAGSLCIMGAPKAWTVSHLAKSPPP